MHEYNLRYLWQRYLKTILSISFNCYFEINRLSSTRCNVKDYVRKINPIDDYNIYILIYLYVVRQKTIKYNMNMDNKHGISFMVTPGACDRKRCMADFIILFYDLLNISQAFI